MGNCFTKNIDLNLETLSFTPLREKYKDKNKTKKTNINITIKIYTNHDKYFNKK
jgi:hypothetical protein